MLQIKLQTKLIIEGGAFLDKAHELTAYFDKLLRNALGNYTLPPEQFSIEIGRADEDLLIVRLESLVETAPNDFVLAAGTLEEWKEIKLSLLFSDLLSYRSARQMEKIKGMK